MSEKSTLEAGVSLEGADIGQGWKYDDEKKFYLRKETAELSSRVNSKIKPVLLLRVEDVYYLLESNTTTQVDTEDWVKRKSEEALKLLNPAQQKLLGVSDSESEKDEED